MYRTITALPKLPALNPRLYGVKRAADAAGRKICFVGGFATSASIILTLAGSVSKTELSCGPCIAPRRLVMILLHLYSGVMTNPSDTALPHPLALRVFRGPALPCLPPCTGACHYHYLCTAVPYGVRRPPPDPVCTRRCLPVPLP